MSTFQYEITNFDREKMTLHVVFDDNTWADIRLAVPLPRNVQELEEIIKRFTATKQQVEAMTTPDADISYIDSLIGTRMECERLSTFVLDDPIENRANEVSL